MRRLRLFSFFFLILIGLSCIGNYAFLLLIRDQVAGAIGLKIQASGTQLGGQMILRIPFTLPYTVDSENYEPVKGQFSYDGVVYQLVKQRLYKDTLYIVCIRDSKTTEVTREIADYTRSFGGHDAEGTADLALLSIVTKYYSSTHNTVYCSAAGWKLDCKFSDVIETHHTATANTIFRPPRFI